jgi:hypothetical protein
MLAPHVEFRSAEVVMHENTWWTELFHTGQITNNCMDVVYLCLFTKFV